MIDPETWSSIMKRAQDDGDIAALVSELQMTRAQRDHAVTERDEWRLSPEVHWQGEGAHYTAHPPRAFIKLTSIDEDQARADLWDEALDGPGLRFASIIVMRQGGEKIEDAVTDIAAALYWSRFRARLIKREGGA